MQVNIEQLKAATQAAIANGKQLKREEDDRLAALEAERLAGEDAEIQEVISAMPAICLAAARNGHQSATIYKDRGGRGPGSRKFSGINRYRIQDEHHLSRKGVVIYDTAFAAGLNPSVSYETDGNGMDSWIQIAVSWE